MDALTSIGGAAYFTGNNSLINLTGLNALTSVASTFYINEHSSLLNLTGLNALTFIGGGLDISFNSSLTDLTGLDALNSIGGGLYIFNNSSLTDITDLDNVDHTTINYLSIYNCDLLSLCNIQVICDYLFNYLNEAYIEGNATGCSRSEVETACGITDSDGDGVDNEEDNCKYTPNPDQTDTDGDAIGDACDGCPEDPNKIEPGVCGCGTEDIDNDGDGFMACDGGDCNDSDPNINIGMPEILDNDIDDNCDGLVDMFPYCLPSISFPCDYSYLSNVTLGSINNNSDCSNGRSDFTYLSTIVEPGFSYTISMQGGEGYYSTNNQYATVFVDWNLNGLFEDGGEIVLTDFLIYPDYPNTSTLIIPSDAVVGSYRMRVVTDLEDFGSPLNPCYSTFGEVEDYTLIVDVTCDDTDSDGICDNEDNCPNTENADQADTDNDGIGNVCDNCISIANSEQLDSDCDGIGDVCDVCPGGDDTIDNNNDGQPDCKYPPSYSQIISSWKCGNNKVYICHSNGKSLCISYSALAAHIAHGDYLGSCGNASCGQNLKGSDNHGYISGENITNKNDIKLAHNDDIMLIYPNPVLNLLNVIIPIHTHAPIQIQLYNSMGQEVLNKNYVHDNPTIQLNIQFLPDGLYYIKSTVDGIQTLKSFSIIK